MKWVYDDGGRAAAGYKGKTRDCVCRAISIAAEMPYQEVYDLINTFAKKEKASKRKRGKSNARTGVYKPTIRKIMNYLGWEWVPTQGIGVGCTMHLNESELPKIDRMVVSVSKHSVAVINGVIHDTFDPNGDFYDINKGRCVYGYYKKRK